MRRAFLTQMAALAAGIAAPKAFAQSAGYPDRPIKIIVGFAPGDQVDTVIRIAQPKLSEALGQPIVIENRPGASTSIACIAVKQSPSDGYTLMFTAGGGHSVHTIDRPQFPYDPIRDFTPIATLSRSGWAFVVHPSVPVTSITEYVAYAKANPGKISFGSSGIGLVNHLAMERFNMAAGIKAVHVPYKSGPNAVLDLVAGRIQAYFTSRSSLQASINAGQLRALVYTATRQGEFPPSMSFAAAGLPELDTVDTNNVLLGPANMPAPVIGKLNVTIEKVLAMPDIQASMAAQQQQAYYQNSQQVGERLRNEQATYRQVIKDANIKMDG